MYKLMLAWRYLRTRYIALASIVSVTLGVATLVVVNSVMSGFTHEMHKRLHGILSDMELMSPGLGEIYEPRAHVRKSAGLWTTISKPCLPWFVCPRSCIKPSTVE